MPHRSSQLGKNLQTLRRRSSSRDEIDFALAEGEALGIIGPNGAGKTTLFGIATGTVRARQGPRLLAGADITHLAPERRCRLGIGALVSNSAAVRRHERVRESGGRGRLRRQPPRARRLRPLRGAARPMRARGQGEPACRQPDAARPQAARARTCTGNRAARASSRRGRWRPDRARMRDAGRTHSRASARAASPSSGSSTSCMR